MDSWVKIVDRLGGLLHAKGGPTQPVSESQMSQVEAELGVSVPSQLRSFLNEYGSCSFLVCVKFPRCEGLPDHFDCTVSEFSAVALPDGSGPCLLKAAQINQDRLPKELLGFGVGWSEHFELCIGASGKYKGKIYAWDLALEPELDDFPDPEEKEKARWAVIYEVAPSFEHFMESLLPYEDCHEEVAKIEPAASLDMDWRVHTDHIGGVIDAYGGPYRSIPPAQMQGFEVELGVQIPAQYRSFLLQFGSGYFLGQTVFNSKRAPKARLVLNSIFFFGNKRPDGRGTSLLDAVAQYQAKIPEGYLPMAACHVGAKDHGALLIQVDGEDPGAVFYWANPKHTGLMKIPSTLKERNGVYRLAPDFLSFIQALKES